MRSNGLSNPSPNSSYVQAGQRKNKTQSPQFSGQSQGEGASPFSSFNNQSTNEGFPSGMPATMKRALTEVDQILRP